MPSFWVRLKRAVWQNPVPWGDRFWLPVALAILSAEVYYRLARDMSGQDAIIAGAVGGSLGLLHQVLIYLRDVRDLRNLAPYVIDVGPGETYVINVDGGVYLIAPLSVTCRLPKRNPTLRISLRIVDSARSNTVDVAAETKPVGVWVRHQISVGKRNLLQGVLTVYGHSRGYLGFFLTDDTLAKNELQPHIVIKNAIFLHYYLLVRHGDTESEWDVEMPRPISLGHVT